MNHLRYKRHLVYFELLPTEPPKYVAKIGEELEIVEPDMKLCEESVKRLIDQRWASRRVVHRYDNEYWHVELVKEVCPILGQAIVVEDGEYRDSRHPNCGPEDYDRIIQQYIDVMNQAEIELSAAFWEDAT